MANRLSNEYSSIIRITQSAQPGPNAAVSCDVGVKAFDWVELSDRQ